MTYHEEKCIGGLESDENCHTFAEITDEQGRKVCGDIIKGLYVAGNMQGGRFGMEYPIGLKGVSHSVVMYYGKIAGENKLAELLIILAVKCIRLYDV